MRVFWDPTGHRGRAARFAVALVLVTAVATVTTFSLPFLGEALASLHVPPIPPVEEPRSQGRDSRTIVAPSESAPIVAAFVVNWDPASRRSLERHADRLTHVMPEWIRVGGSGELIVDEDPEVRVLARHLDLTPMVSNYAAGKFRRDLALRLIGTPESRRTTAVRLRALCFERGYSGVNLDLEALEPADHDAYAALIEEIHREFEPDGYVLSVDVPANPGRLPVERLAAASDFLVVMAYDLHSPADEPGPARPHRARPGRPRRLGDHAVPRRPAGHRKAFPHPPSAAQARGRHAALRRLHALRDGLPRQVHLHPGRRKPGRHDREACQDLQDRPRHVRVLRLLRGSLP